MSKLRDKDPDHYDAVLVRMMELHAMEEWNG